MLGAAAMAHLLALALQVGPRAGDAALGNVASHGESGAARDVPALRAVPESSAASATTSERAVRVGGAESLGDAVATTADERTARAPSADSELKALGHRRMARYWDAELGIPVARGSASRGGAGESLATPRSGARAAKVGSDDRAGIENLDLALEDPRVIGYCYDQTAE